MPKPPLFPDPFRQAREQRGLGEIDDQGDPVLMVLRHRDLRRSAHKYQDFSSEVEPGRIVVPSEVNIRDMRQIPFEMDPPRHTAYRAVLEDWFRRPLDQDYQAALRPIIDELVEKSLSVDSCEVVHDFALPLQSRALTLLLNVPFAEAETWISWGTHVFRSDDNPLDGDKATVLYSYIDKQIEKATREPGEDIYSALLATEVNGRKMTKEEVKGVLVLTFAGGRDTIINAVTNSIAYFANHSSALEQLRQQPEIIPRAVEELVRYFSPLTQMGRVATKDTQVCEHAVKSDSRISLCWASANRDASVFENPDEVILDRSVNPHVAFGFSHHKCLGATHTRTLMKLLLQRMIEKVQSIEILEAQEKIEHWGDFDRKVGYEQLKVKMT
ncbi:MAG TPA: cytochrome P450 [Saprospiraceae bacterium]|nr:cytochrome P450 [Saprospiraceae bacterium]